MDQTKAFLGLSRWWSNIFIIQACLLRSGDTKIPSRIEVVDSIFLGISRSFPRTSRY